MNLELVDVILLENLVCCNKIFKGVPWSAKIFGSCKQGIHERNSPREISKVFGATAIGR